MWFHIHPVHPGKARLEFYNQIKDPLFPRKNQLISREKWLKMGTDNSNNSSRQAAEHVSLTAKKHRRFPKHLSVILEAPDWKPSPSHIRVCPALGVQQNIPTTFYLPASTSETKRTSQMNQELLRLITFSSWPESALYSGLKMARLGFYKTGSSKPEEATCFACGWTNDKWTAREKPLVTHQSKQPDCPFIKLEETSNVPMGTPPDITSELSHPQNTEASLHEDATREDTCSIREIYFRSMFDEPLYSDLIERSSEPDYNVELDRLATFTQSDWRRDHPINPLLLARAGFYYAGSQDRCRCAFCSNVLRDWDDGDDPMEQHASHFPACPYISGEDCGNVPWDHKTVITRTTTLVVNNSEPDVRNANPTLVLTDTFQGDPRHLGMILESVRLESFANWRFEHVQNKKRLAQAGLFYGGNSDLTKCFFCDGGLRNWEREDDPWTEHARWYPRCEFVRKVKGHAFISSARSVAAQRNTASSQTPAVQRVFPVDSRQIKAILDTNLCVHLVQMGYDRDILKKVITRRMQLTGDVFSSAGELAEAYQTQAPQVVQHLLPELPEAKSQVPAIASDPVESEETELTCRVCMVAKSTTVFLPCGHICCCHGCAQNLQICPICRSAIRGTVLVKEN